MSVVSVESQILGGEDLGPDPIAAFERWFADAKRAGLPAPETMTLATATPEGRPSARIVLLKQVDARGFVFFTNYESRKAEELERNPFAALVFYWEPLTRQVRVEGRVERISPAESDAYFRTRPRGSRIGAIASPQSRPVPDRAFLERRYREVDAAYPGEQVPRPPHWGGYRVVPERIEFWLGAEHRFHERVCFERAGSVWTTIRLAP